MCIRFLIIVFLIIIMMFLNLFAHDPDMHQYITREAFQLLQYSFPTQLSEMGNYIGNNEVWSGGSADGSFGALKIVSGASLEDEYDVVYHYGLGADPFIPNNVVTFLISATGSERAALTTITHFWDADYGESFHTVLRDEVPNVIQIYIEHTYNAMQKMRKYINGDYDFLWAYNNIPHSWDNCYPTNIHTMTKFSIASLINFYNAIEDFQAISRMADNTW